MDTGGLMESEPVERTERAASRRDGRRTLRLAVKAVLVVLLALLTARLVLAILTPLPRPAVSAGTQEAAPEADLTIFSRFDPFIGTVPAPVQTQAAQATETRLNLTLFGTFLGDPPSAIIQASGGRQGVYFLGDTIAPGVTIEEIRLDQVLLKRNGRMETLSLPHRDGRSGSANGGGGAAVAPRAGTGNVRGMIDNLATYIRIQKNPGGEGFLLFAGNDPAYFDAAGLENGDRLLAINSTPINGPGDLASLASTLQREPVELSIDRNGRRLALEFDLTEIEP